MQQVDGNTGFPKTTHLGNEKQAGLVVAPVAIVEVSRDHEKGDLLLNGKFNKPFKGLSRRVPNTLGGSSLLPDKSQQWAVEMNVRCMHEAKRSHDFMIWDLPLRR